MEAADMDSLLRDHSLTGFINHKIYAAQKKKKKPQDLRFFVTECTHGISELFSFFRRILLAHNLCGLSLPEVAYAFLFSQLF
jgi:hypothetical protein